MKRTLSKAASSAKLGFTDFLGINNRQTAPAEDEPYWMKDDFWEGTDVEIQGSAPPFDSPSLPTFSPEFSSDFPPPYKQPPSSSKDETPPPYTPPSNSFQLQATPSFSEMSDGKFPERVSAAITRGTMRGRGRGRGGGRGRGKAAMVRRGQGDPRMKGKEAKKPPKLEKHRPYFIILVTLIDVAIMIYEIVVNGGFESFKVNPWFGPSVETLVDLGGKFAPRITAGEWWRFFTPIFMHVGIGHIFMNMLMQVRVGRSLEQSYGAFRIAPIYLLCGIYGNLISCVFLPTEVQVGASGALFGFMGVLLSDLIQNWGLLQSPVKNLCSLLITVIISFAVGLFLPGVDNFAHLGGFVMGVITGFIFLPNLGYGKCQTRWRICVICTFVPAAVVLFGATFVAFYTGVNANEWCTWCGEISCIDSLPWCKTSTV